MSRRREIAEDLFVSFSLIKTYLISSFCRLLFISKDISLENVQEKLPGKFSREKPVDPGDLMRASLIIVVFCFVFCFFVFFVFVFYSKKYVSKQFGFPEVCAGTGGFRKLQEACRFFSTNPGAYKSPWCQAVTKIP